MEIWCFIGLFVLVSVVIWLCVRLLKKRADSILMDKFFEELDSIPYQSTPNKIHKMRVETLKGHFCVLLKGIFEICGKTKYLGNPVYGERYLKGDSTLYYHWNNCTYHSVLPKHIIIGWFDCQNQKYYKLETNLPVSLEKYFDDKNSFCLYDVVFSLMPNGRVLLYLREKNYVHDILIDYPLQGVETNEYQNIMEDYLTRKQLSIDRLINSNILLNFDIDLYTKRFDYKIKIFPTRGMKVDRYICNFFNLERLNFCAFFKYDYKFAHIKDVFIKFYNDDIIYICFLFFNKEEILKAYDMVFNSNDKDTSIGEFIIKVGYLKESFVFELKCRDKSYTFRQTEICLYRHYPNNLCKLIFKNYQDAHKNTFDYLYL